ncbi:MAG: DUF4214 domain-containing protein [Verrucomicrobia bacterium]|nr:DUF4214 domain-containing protein [Verrucomicrobiota bacterium]
MAVGGYLHSLKRLSVRSAFDSLKRLVTGIPSGTNDLSDPGHSRFVYPAAVNALYKAAFGRFADEGGLSANVSRLQAGTALEAIAEDLTRSAEFQTRHGSGQQVDGQYLTALYRDGLGREPDPQGFAHWLAEGEKGATRAKVLATLAGSDEALHKAFSVLPGSANHLENPEHVRLVNSLYKAAFGRLADEAGLSANVRRLRTGTALEAIAEDLTRSAEFQTRHGSGQQVDGQYLTALYRDGLGREPDPQGFAHWLAKGENGATRAKVLADFAGSDEALANALQTLPDRVPESQHQDHAQLVNSLYQAALGRFADGAEFAGEVERLRSGTPLEKLAENLVDSDEFKARHGARLSVDLGYISGLYRAVFRRKPELERLAFWLAAGDKGATRAQILVAIAGSENGSKGFAQPKLDPTESYQHWIREYDTISNTDRSVIRTQIATLPYRPVISVILSLAKTSAAALDGSIKSVSTQLYPNWELCMALDRETGPLVETVFGAWMPVDPRVRSIRSDSFAGTAGAVNAALELATGEFVTFLHAGDRLAEHALYEVALALGERGQTDVLYSDRDHLAPDGRRSDPWFKPGWDPDLLLAQDYISNLAVYRRDLVASIGFLRPRFEGAEFHDLALRATAETDPGRITHVPTVLYHAHRTEATSHPEAAAESLRAVCASRRAVRDHLNVRGYGAALVRPAPQMPHATRVVWPVPAPEPLVSVIIPTRDRADLLAACIDGVLHRTDYRNLEVLIVDNESVDPAALALIDRLSGEYPAIKILRLPGPFNYSALNNAAAREAKGEILLLLNNDVTVIAAGWLREMVANALRPDVGVVGAKLLYADGRVQHGGVVMGPEGWITHVHRQAECNGPGYFGQLALLRTLSAVTGACVAVRRSVFLEVGGLDEVNLPVSFNDIDFCLRVGDYGYRVVWTPAAELFHLESASRGQENTDPSKRVRLLLEYQYMRQTWGTLLESADPFHNPNLLFASEYFEVPSSPRRERPWYRFFEEVHALNRRLTPAEAPYRVGAPE